MSERWDHHFLQLCIDHARMSKDPSSMVGAIIVGPDREIRSAGFNGFPRGIADTDERLGDRETKLRLVVHGEMNAVLAAARVGTPLKGCTLYLVATDISGAVWGGLPCIRCAVGIIQAGITEIVSWSQRKAPSRLYENLRVSRAILDEAGVMYRAGCVRALRGDLAAVLGAARLRHGDVGWWRSKLRSYQGAARK